MDFNALHGLHQPQDASLVDTADPTSLQDGSLIDIEVVTLQSSGPELPVHPEFAFTDGTIELQTLDCIFCVHEFQLTKFAVFANRIQEAREQATESGADPSTRISIPVFMKSDDFVDTLRLLYASFVPSPEVPSFDCVAFISALRIATLYDYPDLREFAIRELDDEFLLPAIRRFELANELSLFDWESAILNEFCNRSEPISEDEAISLGETRMMHILDYREKQPSLQTSESQAPKIVTNQFINQCVPLFEPGDGDVTITVNETCFETHKYLIKRFRGPKTLLVQQPLEVTIQRDDISAEDFCEMFKILYALSIIAGPFEFAPHTLISTPRVATIYEYQALRDCCIQHLERLELDPIKRLELAHEFDLPTWVEPAYHELGIRDEPITKEEANIIGFDAFISIAEMREKE
ncbi:unnamed protein product [Rhizoctonia solani]|uniref:BTB domain-containing protein n=1 Tax=Rhizoctonia solani TaxID=456999 RepID=A0A8H2WQD2_9AGAM|nr:unnamed protein product [Rhizoctonia solani]